MDLAILASPTALLHSRLGELPGAVPLTEYEAWWRTAGEALSAGVDRAGTPWLQMFAGDGERIDQVVMAGGYRDLLLQGYRAGVVWRGFSGDSLVPTFLLGYVTAFFDPGLYCPYTVSLATALALAKYGAPPLRERYLAPLLRRDDAVWQGATWMTEIGGGSDLGANVATAARPAGERWLLDGDKYFASNVGAELAVVAARPEGAPAGVRGLALFLLPRLRASGETQLPDPAAQGQDRHPFGADRGSGAGGERGVPAGDGRDRDLSDSRGTQRLALCQQRRRRRPGPACPGRRRGLRGAASRLWPAGPRTAPAGGPVRPALR